MIHTDDSLISNSLCRAASDFPEREAMVTSQERLTYGALYARIHLLSQQIQAYVLRPHEKIAWAEMGSSLFLELLYALGPSGAVGVPLHHNAPADEWSTQCSLCDVSLLIISPMQIEKAYQVFDIYAGLRCILLIEVQDGKALLTLLRQRKEAKDDSNREKSEPGDALILCSSGTTGYPKGIVLTHRNLLTNQRSLVDYMGIRCQDTMLVSKPLVHSSTLIESLSILSVGGRIILSPWLTARGILSMLHKERCTIFCMVPTMALEVLQNVADGAHQQVSLRKLSVSGSPVSSRVLLGLAKKLPTCGIYHAYGLTEASPRVSALLPHELAQYPDSVGRAIPHVSVCVVDADDHVLPAGQIGELVVQGENVMRAYYANPEMTTRTLRQPGLHTGDLAFINEDGYIHLQGRKDDLINCGGQKVYPLEIERVLLEHPGIGEALVQGQADERLDVVPVAFIVPAQGCHLDEKAVREHCKRYLAAYKIPRFLYVREALHRTASGKVRRQQP